MEIPFAIIAALTIVSGIAAITLRNLVHCALSLAITFAGVAALYLQLGAPFAGWSQVIVYIGAVAILMVFAILLTRSDNGNEPSIFSKSWAIGAAITLAVFGVLTAAILKSGITHKLPEPKLDPTVKQIGTDLMTNYILPLEAIGLLLTAAAIGAVIIAMKDKDHPETPSAYAAAEQALDDSATGPKVETVENHQH